MDIFLGATASEAERHAAAELRRAVKAMAGREIPICRGASAPQGERLLVGESGLAPSERLRLPALREDEVEVRRLDPARVVFRGGGPRGVLYAVYEWLDSLGWRWYHPDVTAVPACGNPVLPDLLRAAPHFEYRDALWRTTLKNPAWACRNRYNGHFQGNVPRLGGAWRIEPLAHSFRDAVPPDVYWKTHPEYFCWRHGQGRVGGYNDYQICLSNPDVLEIFTEFVLKRMADPAVRAVAVSPNDCSTPCQCPECAAADRKADSHSGSLVAFTNRIAAETCRRYPDKYVLTTAYLHTQPPPRGMAVHDNAIVWLAHMAPSCDTHPLEECERNARYVGHLKGWRRAAKRVFVWHYVTNWHHPFFFHANLDALAKDIRFYRDAGVSGVFFQGQGRTKACSLDELHSYVQGRMAWNADRDYWREAGEFVDAVYGDGGPAVLKMLDVLHDNVRRGVHSHLSTSGQLGLYRADQLAKARKLLDGAFRAAAGDAAATGRLETVRLWLDFTAMAGSRPLEKRRASFHVEAAPDGPRLFRSVWTRMGRLGLRPAGRGAASRVMKERLGWFARTRDLPLAALEDGRIRVEVCPELGGMAATLLDKATGRDLFRKPAPGMVRYPYIGGFTEGNTAGGSGGFENAYRVERAAPGEVAVGARIGGGVRVRRVFSLDARRPALRIESTYTNTGGRAARVRPHWFIILSLGELEDIRLFARSPDGTVRDLCNTVETCGTLRAWQWVNLRDRTAPAGAWGCFDTGLGIGLLDEFAPHAALRCGSNAYLPDRRVLMETVLRPRVLGPGRSMRIRHRLLVIRELPIRARRPTAAELLEAYRVANPEGGSGR